MRRRSELQRLADNSHSLEDLALLRRCSVAELRKQLRDNGVVFAPSRGRKPKLSLAELNRLERMRDEGRSMTDIAEQLGISEKAVSRYLSRYCDAAAD